MPIHIRRYHIRKISELHEERNQKDQEAMSKMDKTSKSIAKTPNVPKNLNR